MKNYKTVTGFYGSGKTPCDVLVCENANGSNWYVVQGGCVVNLTYWEMYNGINVEMVQDIDCFTSSKPIENLEQLEKQIES